MLQAHQMRAAIIDQHGGPEVLHIVERPVPPLGPGQVLIRVHACGLNRGLDARTRQNGAGRKILFPHTLGTEIVGEVASVDAAVQRRRVGDRVLVIPWSTCGTCPDCRASRENACAAKWLLGIDLPGGYAEYLTIEEQRLISIPPGLPLEEAATLPITFTTAWHMLTSRARVKAGETVLVLGAAGAIGLAALQLAKHVGARVLAAASSEAKLDVVRRLGVDGLIDYAAMPGFAEEVKRLTNGRGADVVVEHIGASTWQQSIDSLAPNGRLVMCGATSGHELQFDARELWRKNISLLFSNSGTTADLRKVVSLWASGKIHPLLVRVFALEDVVQAHQLLENRAVIGKVVLRVGK